MGKGKKGKKGKGKGANKSGSESAANLGKGAGESGPSVSSRDVGAADAGSCRSDISPVKESTKCEPKSDVELIVQTQDPSVATTTTAEVSLEQPEAAAGDILPPPPQEESIMAESLVAHMELESEEPAKQLEESEVVAIESLLKLAEMGPSSGQTQSVPSPPPNQDVEEEIVSKSSSKLIHSLLADNELKFRMNPVRIDEYIHNPHVRKYERNNSMWNSRKFAERVSTGFSR